jgi:Glyoxalase-like domain
LTTLTSDNIEMAIATFKDLCINATNPQELALFWATVLGLEPTLLDDGDVQLAGEKSNQTIWFDGVPEKKSIEHRVQLCLFAPSLTSMTNLGARVRTSNEHHAVLCDVEDGEFSIEIDDEYEDIAWKSIVITALDPAAQATWWAQLLDGCIVHYPDRSSVVAIDAPFTSLEFVQANEPKTLKNRLHIDLQTEQLDGVVAQGANLLRAKDHEINWTVFADPEGNEFCVFEK